ncbi:MAG: pseudouridine synthase [Armatimonadota bacterium]
MERLQKLIAGAGVASRRQAETLIMAGRVTVNGEVVTLLGTRVDPQQDVVVVDGVPLTQPSSRTIMLNKPANYITTRSDPHARNTVMSLIPDIPGLHPIGRLDKDTTGLLLLTNDGNLTYALTHPKHHVDKTYRLWMTGRPGNEALETLRHGVLLEDGMTAPARVKRLQSGANATELEITIHEGRKRQVRRMVEAIGGRVTSLTRISVGPLSLGDLPEGQWRDLTSDEIHALYEAAGVEL